MKKKRHIFENLKENNLPSVLKCLSKCQIQCVFSVSFQHFIYSSQFEVDQNLSKLYMNFEQYPFLS